MAQPEYVALHLTCVSCPEYEGEQLHWRWQWAQGEMPPMTVLNEKRAEFFRGHIRHGRVREEWEAA